MKWLPLILGIIWYWWRLYSLSFNTTYFPDPQYAKAVWERRAGFSFVLGAVVFAYSLYALEMIHVWWVIAATFALSLAALHLLQPLLVALIIFSRTGFAAMRIRTRREARSPWFASLAWSYYLTDEEKHKG